jgi:hypothetical protein
MVFLYCFLRLNLKTRTLSPRPLEFDQERLIKPAFLTLFFNGLLVHHRVELLGATSREPIAVYSPHPPELPFSLQGHAGPGRFRNIWIRRLRGYDA